MQPLDKSQDTSPSFKTSPVSTPGTDSSNRKVSLGDKNSLPSGVTPLNSKMPKGVSFTASLVELAKDFKALINSILEKVGLRKPSSSGKASSNTKTTAKDEAKVAKIEAANNAKALKNGNKLIKESNKMLEYLTSKQKNGIAKRLGFAKDGRLGGWTQRLQSCEKDLENQPVSTLKELKSLEKEIHELYTPVKSAENFFKMMGDETHPGDFT